MKNKSIAVIGAGLGGLASAAYLAQKGFNVKLFERLSRAGGVVDSFKRGNYVFEATTHQLSYYGGPKKFKDILKMLGIDNIELLSDPYSYDSYFINNGKINNYLLPVGEYNLKEYLYSYFPKYKKEIEQHIEILKGCKRDLFDVTQSQITDDTFDIGEYVTKLFKKPYIEFVNFENETLNSILSQHWIYTGSPISEVSALALLGFQSTFLIESPFIMGGGSNYLVNQLLHTIKTNNGQIFFNSNIDKMIFEDNKIKKVIINKIPYDCDYVISSIDPSALFFNYLGEKHIPNYYKKRLFNQLPSQSVFNIYVGLPVDLSDYGFKTPTSIFNFRTNQNQNYELSSNTPAKNSTFILTNYSFYNDFYSKEGTSSLVITEFDNCQRWMNLSESEYINLKEKTQEFIVKKVEKITGLPLNDKAEVIFSATPKTFMYYSGNKNGFMGSRNKWLSGKLKQLDFDTPIKNLYLVGSSASHAGVTLALVSGLIVSNKIIRKEE